MAQNNVHRPWFTQDQIVPSDPIEITPEIRASLSEQLSPDARAIVEERWPAIRTHHRESNFGVASSYTFNLLQDNTQDAVENHINRIFRRQSTAFKLNYSVGLILYNKETKRYRYYHSSVNNYISLDAPVIIENTSDISNFTELINLENIKEKTLQDRPDSSWILISLSNITFYVYHLINIPMGGSAEEERGGKEMSKKKGEIINIDRKKKIRCR